jgi:hypothetical protein
MTKSARFLQKNDKKLQKIPIFLPQISPKPTTLRQIDILYPGLFQRQLYLPEGLLYPTHPQFQS